MVARVMVARVTVARVTVARVTVARVMVARVMVRRHPNLSLHIQYSCFYNLCSICKPND
jgi:hypothetical protein